MDLPYSVARAYCDQQSRISGMAVKELSDVIAMLPWGGSQDDVMLSRDAVISFMETLIDRYGSAAAAHAAETFEVYSESAMGGKLLKKAVGMAEVAPAEDVARAVHFASKALFGEDVDVESFTSRVCSQLTRYIHSAANRTMADAGATKYARILGESEHGSCPMCEEWASLGYVWPDEDMVEPHDGCQCSLVPGFGKDPKLVGKPER